MTIQDRRANRYYILANIIILCVGLLLVLAGFLFRSDGFDLGSLLVGIGSDTIVVAVVFFLGRMLLIDPQDELKESLARLESRIVESRSSFFVSRTELRSLIPPEYLVAHSQDLLLAGVNLRDTVRSYRPQWVEQVEKGVRLRFLVLDPESPDTEAIAWTSQTKGSSEEVKAEIELTLQTLKALKRKAESTASSSIEIRLLSHQPPISFALVNPNSADGLLSAGLRLHGQQGSIRPFWILRTGDEWFDAFVEACEKLWDASRPVA